jgi:alkanesulfonate monooxygenase SsuD/methylene tetrahydromethanopterin reductase-like flavin-dependent oxidoreductase (luciferase family)
VNGTGVPILLGGRIDPAIRRMARWGMGMTMGLAGPDQIRQLIPRLEAAWREAGRPGTPRVVAHTQFAVGPEAEAGTARYIMDYYGSQFRDRAQEMVQAMPRDKQALRDTARRFEDAGADSMIFSPGHAAVDQVDRLAEAVL